MAGIFSTMRMDGVFRINWGRRFCYDGANAAQELTGGIVSANLLSGGIDEIFSRNDSSGGFTQLKDVLGSTIALVDSSGNLLTSYSYDPFRSTSVSGLANTNVYQYTGRENESDGMYYYRARYYSPSLHRFISEDPLGFVGSGANFYAYAGNSPTNFTDPAGLSFDSLPCLMQGGVCGEQKKSSRGDTFVNSRLLCNDYTSDSLTFFVISLNHQADNYGNHYFTPAGGYGKGWPVGVSHTWGCLNGEQPRPRTCTGLSLGLGGTGVCWGASWSLRNIFSPK